MAVYSELIESLKIKKNEKEKAKTLISRLTKENVEKTQRLDELDKVQKMFSTISDDNLAKTLDYVTDVINKALSEIFKSDVRKVHLEKALYGGKHSHINLVLLNGDGVQRDIVLQAGSGLRQVVSFLYTLSMIEIQGGRKLLVMDELLGSVHPKAKNVLLDLMEIFTEEGFQFLMVEYGVNDFGKMYIVENVKGESTVSVLDHAYEDEIYLDEEID